MKMAVTTVLSAAPPPFSTLTTAAAAAKTRLFNHSSPFPKLTLQTNLHRNSFRSQASNNNSATEEEPGGGVFDAESFFFGGEGRLAENDDDGEEEEEEEGTESSVELLVRFLQSIVKKVSKRAKKASRSILPPAISTQLVSFAVDGFMVLAFLSIIKALLEVVCNLGGTVFALILVLRVIWATASYFQTSGSNFNHSGSSFGSARPVS